MRRWLGAAALVAAALWWSPTVGYVTSGSMEPALRVGDGFVAVRLPPRPGSVIVYRPLVLPVEYVVHRVVGTLDGTFLTRGDRSEATDQAKGEPPVTPDRIAGVVVLRIPGVQRAVEGVRAEVLERLPVWLPPWVPVAVAAIPLALSGTRWSRREARALWRLRVSALLRGVGLAAALAALGAYGLSRDLAGFPYLVSENPGPLPWHVGVYRSGAVPFRIRNPSVLPVVYVARGVGGTVPEPAWGVVPPRRERSIRVWVPPDRHPGWRRGYVELHVYPGLLPAPLVAGAARMHPLLAAVLVASVPALACGLLARWAESAPPLGRLLGLPRPR